MIAAIPTSRREGGSATGGSARSSAVGPAREPSDRERRGRRDRRERRRPEPTAPNSCAVAATPASRGVSA